MTLFIRLLAPFACDDEILPQPCLAACWGEPSQYVNGTVAWMKPAWLVMWVAPLAIGHPARSRPIASAPITTEWPFCPSTRHEHASGIIRSRASALFAYSVAAQCRDWAVYTQWRACPSPASMEWRLLPVPARPGDTWAARSSRSYCSVPGFCRSTQHTVLLSTWALQLPSTAGSPISHQHCECSTYSHCSVRLVLCPNTCSCTTRVSHLRWPSGHLSTAA